MISKYKQYKFPTIATDDKGDDFKACTYSKKPQDDHDPGISDIESQAYEDGYAQGCNQGLALEKIKAEPINQVLVHSASITHEHKEMILKKAQLDAIDMAVFFAKKIVGNEIVNDISKYSKTLRRVIDMTNSYEHITIKLHPDDHETIQTIMEEQLPDINLDQKFTFKHDRSLHRGGCVLETDFGIIDARIDHQIDSIESELMGVVSSQPPNKDIDVSTDELFSNFINKIENSDPIKSCGHVTQVVGLVVEANGPVTQLGCVCEIHGNDHEPPVKAEVLGFRDQTVLMMPLEEIRSISPGSRVVAKQQNASISVGNQLLGRVIDGLGVPIDGLGALNTDLEYPIYANSINPLLRKRIQKPLDMGVRAINGLLTIGCGQRIGIFAGSGVGKSTLMGVIARKSSADVNVIALIGERGRELNEFIERELGEEGLKKSVVVVATSDHLPLVRVRGAFVATAIAEFFRDQGLQVNLMMDSLTRFATAQREIGLALGEPPTTKGYTPSVFTLMPKLLERAGTSDNSGTITGLYTVLVEGDDINEPISDAARSILDGHIVLTRDLADQNHYPAIDILKSVSRVMTDISGLQHKHNAGRFRELLATYRKAEDLINIGAYVDGSNPKIDEAIERIDHMNKFLRQDIQENVGFDDSLEALEQIMCVGL